MESRLALDLLTKKEFFEGLLKFVGLREFSFLAFRN